MVFLFALVFPSVFLVWQFPILSCIMFVQVSFFLLLQHGIWNSGGNEYSEEKWTIATLLNFTVTPSFVSSQTMLMHFISNGVFDSMREQNAAKRISKTFIIYSKRDKSQLTRSRCRRVKVLFAGLNDVRNIRKFVIFNFFFASNSFGIMKQFFVKKKEEIPHYFLFFLSNSARLLSLIRSSTELGCEHAITSITLSPCYGMLSAWVWTFFM